jgi:hypothetical protein
MPRKNTTEFDTVTCPPRLWFEAVFKNDPRVGDLPEQWGKATGSLSSGRTYVE